ncbi:MAG: response regulator [Deltaproteobacteria bacterium]|nr:response regulator [Deltaproteobacteria bacterium]
MPLAELERLRRENATLDEQVKLLVRMEQRFHRARTEHERELARIRTLGDLSLACIGVEDPATILECAVEVMRATFDVDAALAICVGDDERRPNDGAPWVACAPPGAWEASEAGVDAARRAAERAFDASIASPAATGEAGRAAHAALAAALGLEPAALVACMPLASPSGRFRGALVARRGERRAAFHRERLDPKHEPFLMLMRAHLERALESCTLTRDLRERGRELAAANADLAASLEELRRAQELLQSQKLQAIGQLAGGVAHDFNNLLTVILGHAEFARMRIPAGSPARDDVVQVIEAGNRAATITQQLLAFGRKQRLTKEVVDLNELASATGRMLARLIGERIQLKLVFQPDVASAYCDRGQLEQAVLNLVVNARDAMPNGGEIRIVTRAATATDVERCGEEFDPTRYVVLAVEDDGVGMPAEVRAHVFEPFFTTKGLASGAGLGLAMVYGYVKQSQGYVSVESEVGRGSTFTLVLPTERPGEGRVAPRSNPAPAAVGDGSTILVVEDDPTLRMVAVRAIGEAGWTVIEAESADAALTAVEKHGGVVDLLVADVVLPRADGVELANRLRKRWPALPVLLISGYPPERLEARRALAGEHRLLAKPFTCDQLVAEAQALLAEARDAREPGHT